MFIKSFYQNSACLICAALLWSCDLVQIKQNEDAQASTVKPIARVNNTYLYPEDLEGIVPAGTTSSDSVDRVSIYINNWVRKQLLIDEATSKIDFDEADIQRKILDYRYSLIAYSYKEYYINQNLNKNVSDEEISNYYHKNQDNFLLKQNIIRGIFIKVPKDAPRINQIKQWMFSRRKKDIDELKSYCFSYATNYSLEDSTWLNFDEIIKNTPLAEIPNRVQFLRTRKYIESFDETSKYLLRIKEYKKTDDIAPLPVVRDQIVDIIINKRKVELSRHLEKEVYDKAVKSHAFEIY